MQGGHAIKDLNVGRQSPKESLSGLLLNRHDIFDKESICGESLFVGKTMLQGFSIGGAFLQRFSIQWCHSKNILHVGGQ